MTLFYMYNRKDLNMYLKKIGLMTIIVVLFYMYSMVNGQTSQECGGFAADVIFLLDTSSSIEQHDFVKQLKFTEDVVKIFDIGRERTQVGLALFSDTVFPQFNLDSYNSKGHIIDRIRNITFKGGRTNTAEALSYVRHKVFTRDQARPGVPRITIILTDGQSNFPEKTAREAKELHLNSVTVFVIGIGSDVDKNELSAIATNPDSAYSFHVGDFDTLSSIKKTLAIKTCEVKYIEPIVQEDIDTDTFFCGRLPCSISIVYGADISLASTKTSKQIISFFTILHDKLQDQLFKVRSAQIVNNCPVSRFPHRERGKSYAPLLRNMRQASPASLSFIKNPGKAMSVLLIDTSIRDLRQSTNEVLRARFKRIDTMVVVVGTAVNKGILERLLRIRGYHDMFAKHVFAVANYDKLEAAITPLMASIKALKCS